MAAQIQQTVPGVSADTTSQFAASEQKLAGDMMSDMIFIMDLAGFLVGFTVLALIVYIATVAKRREYGVMKAIGAGNARLYGMVVLQTFAIVGAGLVVAASLTFALTAAVSKISDTMVLQVTGPSLVRAALFALVIGGLAAGVPVRQLSRLDPATVYRGA